MSDLIDRQMALAFPLANDVYQHASKDFIAGCESYREWIARLPSAGPQITMCQNCDYFDTDDHYCAMLACEMSLNDFCSLAERKTDEE